ncbi:MAG: hypothetical protein LBU65_11340 [Planctomycetaceae bacterium]|jgi:hypothetical protein|nr:hypothetical protein [Planctomycetaceae bacterium]
MSDKMEFRKEKELLLRPKKYSRRELMKFSVVGGLGCLFVYQIVSRHRRKEPRFTFGFDQLADDRAWQNDRSFSQVMSQLPEFLTGFEPEALFVFSPNVVSLYFFYTLYSSYTGVQDVSKKLFIEGKLILDGGNTVDGPLFSYKLEPFQPPQKAAVPYGIITPIILAQPNSYNIVLPPDFALLSLKRIEWSLFVL